MAENLPDPVAAVVADKGSRSRLELLQQLVDAQVVGAFPRLWRLGCRSLPPLETVEKLFKERRMFWP